MLDNVYTIQINRLSGEKKLQNWQIAIYHPKVTLNTDLENQIRKQTSVIENHLFRKKNQKQFIIQN